MFCLDGGEGRRARVPRGPGGTLPVTGFTYITGDSCRAHSLRALNNDNRNGFTKYHRDVYQH